jgi:hypothetical protein
MGLMQLTTICNPAYYASLKLCMHRVSVLLTPLLPPGQTSAVIAESIVEAVETRAALISAGAFAELQPTTGVVGGAPAAPALEAAPAEPALGNAAQPAAEAPGQPHANNSEEAAPVAAGAAGQPGANDANVAVNAAVGAAAAAAAALANAVGDDVESTASLIEASVPGRQHTYTQGIYRKKCTAMYNSMPAANELKADHYPRIIADSSTSKFSYAWLNSSRSFKPSQLTDGEWKTAAKLRLYLPQRNQAWPEEGSLCPSTYKGSACDTGTYTRTAVHALGCRSNRGAQNTRHYLTNQALYQCLRNHSSGAAVVRYEAKVSSIYKPLEGKAAVAQGMRADIVVTFAGEPETYLLDTTYRHPLSTHHFALNPEKACSDGFDAKMTHYTKHFDVDEAHVVPFALDSFGRLHQESYKFIKLFCRKVTAAGTPGSSGSSYSALMRRVTEALSIAFVRGSSLAINSHLRCLPV